jgi:hypothetical protein
VKLQKTRGQQLLPVLVASGRPEKFDMRCQRFRWKARETTSSSPHPYYGFGGERESVTGLT